MTIQVERERRGVPTWRETGYIKTREAGQPLCGLAHMRKGIRGIKIVK